MTETKLTEIFVESDDFLLALHHVTTTEGLPDSVWRSRFSRSEATVAR
ncbi:MAG: hypothetical protein WBA23_19800 [Tunicatimonas sp.]